MPDVTFVKGEYATTELTAGADLALGDIVIKEEKAYIVHPHPIANGAVGTVVSRGGRWRFAADGGSGGEVIAQGTKLYWDDSNDVATATATSNVHIGYADEDKAETDTTILVDFGTTD
jgi:predicted RecA/RadA family phage recombinase